MSGETATTSAISFGLASEQRPIGTRNGPHVDFGKMPKKTPEEITQETNDYLLACMEHNGERSWTIPNTAGGTDSMGDALLSVFCRGLGINRLPPKKARQWARQLSKVAEEWQATKEEALDALGAVLDEQGKFKWLTISCPFQKGFVDAFESCLAQAISEEEPVQELTPYQAERVEEAQVQRRLQREWRNYLNEVCFGQAQLIPRLNRLQVVGKEAETWLVRDDELLVEWLKGRVPAFWEIFTQTVRFVQP